MPEVLDRKAARPGAAVLRRPPTVRSTPPLLPHPTTASALCHSSAESISVRTAIAVLIDFFLHCWLICETLLVDV